MKLIEFNSIRLYDKIQQNTWADRSKRILEKLFMLSNQITQGKKPWGGNQRRLK